MAKSSNAERAKRVNAALALIRRCGSTSEATAMLALEYKISKRQAYRYVQEAIGIGEKIPVPEQKIAFTVKLPVSVIDQVHTDAARTGQSLSEIVSQALRSYLNKRRRRG